MSGGLAGTTMQPASDDGLDMTCLAAGTVAGEARQRIALRLGAWRMSHLVDDVAQIAAELIANAIAATPDREIRVRFTREPRGVLLGVWDGSDRMPQIRPHVELELKDLDLAPERFDHNGGWGLHLVRAFASECGVSKTEPHGKWTWARVPA